MKRSWIPAAALAMAMTASLSSIAPTTATAAGSSLVGQRLTTAGIGQLKLGMTVAQARKLGYVTGSGNCIHTTRAAYRGVMDVEVSANGRINGLEVWGPQIVTKSGAHTGTTYSQLHKMLGAKLKKARYPYEGGYLYGWQVNDANRHMLFVFPSANTRSADKVRGILVFTGARMGSVAEC